MFVLQRLHRPRITRPLQVKWNYLMLYISLKVNAQSYDGYFFNENTVKIDLTSMTFPKALSGS
jgi:hypothetical protein